MSDEQAWCCPSGSAAANDALAGDLQAYVGKQVVLDTSEPLVYIGTLRNVSSAGLWLEHADLHDCRDGHAHKEAYVFEASTHGVRTNRKRIYVLRRTILSISALAEVVQEDLQD